MTLAHMGSWTGGAWLMLLVFLALLVAGSALGIVRMVTGRPAARAEGILAERFARGEIDTDEHRQRLEAIGGRRRRSFLSTAAPALALAGLAGALVVAAVAPGRGHGFMHMTGGMGSMMSGDAGRSGSPPVAGAREVRVAGSEFSFEPAEVRMRVGDAVNLVFENRGMMFHTLTVGGLLDLRANSRDSISGSLRPDRPGRYQFICAVSGHAEAGMRGTIEVE